MTRDTNYGQSMEMPALKKNAGGPIDLMRPGNGTPWEDRGSTGAVAAYFSTVVKTLTSPGLLMDHIRRPETTSDSTSFAMISAAMWMVGVVLYNVYWLYRVLPASTVYEADADPTFYWLTVVIQLALVGGGIFLWLKFGPTLFRSLGATELKGAPPSLISNCFNYAMGPSILAVVPVYGWIAAVLWILIDLMVGARRRLFMKPVSAIINVIIIAFLAVAISIVPYLLIHFVWGSMLGMNGLTSRPEPKPIVKPSRE